MKTFPLFVVMAAVLFFSQPARAQQVSVQDALTEAQRDYIRGDTDAAKERFQFVLELDPHNVTAQNYLRMIQTSEANKGKNGELEKTLTSLVIPRVQLKDATFDSTLDYLKQTAEKASGGKTKVSFVVQVPAEVATRTKVSLDLSDLPFTEVLHYLSELTGFKFSIEKYAITVKMPSGQPTTVASGTDATAPAPDTNAPVAK